MGFGWARAALDNAGTYAADCACGWRSEPSADPKADVAAALAHLHVGECLGCGHHRALAIWKIAHPEYGMCFGCRKVGAERMRGPCDDGRCYCSSLAENQGGSQ